MADRNKKTIYIGGLPQDADESTLLSTFSVFGDVVEVQIPREGARTDGESEWDGRSLLTCPLRFNPAS